MRIPTIDRVTSNLLRALGSARATRLKGFAALTLAALAVTSCGDVARMGKAPVYLVIETLGAVRGGTTEGEPSGFLHSDVITNVTAPPCSIDDPCPTVFSDVGRVVFRLAMKDLGTEFSPTVPTTNNEVTITRYRVIYRRADGRNTPGVDVPYGFDGAVTGTVPASGTLALGFELVRHVAKMEAPLAALRVNPTIIATIAEVWFFGQDRVGNDIAASGSILIEFGNFGDES
jgi:hypothetical protein